MSWTREKENVYKRRLYTARKMMGLCVDCKNLPVEGRVRCIKCLEKERQAAPSLYKRLRAKVWRSKGLCGKCGKIKSKKYYCKYHAEKNKKYGITFKERREALTRKRRGEII